jgi:hypothetical protein
MLPASMPPNESRLSAKPVVLSIEALGSAGLTMAEISARRKEPLTCFPRALSPQLLRHSDEQTIVALVALSEAIHGFAPARLGFGDWAVVSSSRNLGRSAFAGVMNRYRDEGPWGVSVQVIPNCTAHSVAGTISLALVSHGPCIGVGSHSAGEVEALYSIASILRRPKWSGGWIVVSGWSPEMSLDARGSPVSDSRCFAVALAVTKLPSVHSIGQIDINSPTDDVSNQPPEKMHDVQLAPENLTEFLIGANANGGQWFGGMGDSIRAELNITPGWRERLKRARTIKSSVLATYHGCAVS